MSHGYVSYGFVLLILGFVTIGFGMKKMHEHDYHRNSCSSFSNQAPFPWQYSNKNFLVSSHVKKNVNFLKKEFFLFRQRRHVNVHKACTVKIILLAKTSDSQSSKSSQSSEDYFHLWLYLLTILTLHAIDLPLQKPLK